MDCKIAGTEKGITGFQLDLKLPGISHSMMAEAVEKARVARLHVLAEMAKTLAAPRAEISKYAPRITTVQINPEKIGLLIGPGGKNIKKLVEESGCEINIEDDGTVNIYSVSAEGMKIAVDAIAGMTAEAEIGKIYRGKVVTIKEFGAFVEFLPGKDGLVHISELANFRVKQTEDIVKMGDEIWVKCLGVDEKGRVRLSRRAAMAERDQQMGGAPAEGAQGGEGGLGRPKVATRASIARAGNIAATRASTAGIAASAVGATAGRAGTGATATGLLAGDSPRLNPFEGEPATARLSYYYGQGRQMGGFAHDSASSRKMPIAPLGRPE